MARNVYGLDLGSYEIKVYDKKKDTIWKEKDVIALKNEKEIFAVGDEAFSMICSFSYRIYSRRIVSLPVVRNMW